MRNKHVTIDYMVPFNLGKGSCFPQWESYFQDASLTAHLGVIFPPSTQLFFCLVCHAAQQQIYDMKHNFDSFVQG